MTRLLCTDIARVEPSTGNRYPYPVRLTVPQVLFLFFPVHICQQISRLASVYPAKRCCNTRPSISVAVSPNRTSLCCKFLFSFLSLSLALTCNLVWHLRNISFSFLVSVCLRISNVWDFWWRVGLVLWC